MSEVAQRAGQVDIGAAAAVSLWEGTGRADYASEISAPPPATISSQYGRSSTATNGSFHMAFTFAWLGRYCRMGWTIWHEKARSSRPGKAVVKPGSDSRHSWGKRASSSRPAADPQAGRQPG